MQNRHANVQGPFVYDAKPPCKRSRTFCSRCKTAMQTFNALLHTAQNRPANVQGPIAHDAKPSCKRSRTDCSRRKTVMQTFKAQLFTMQDPRMQLQRQIVVIQPFFTIKETVGAQGHTPSTYAKLRYNKPRKSFTPLCSHLSFHVRPH